MRSLLILLVILSFSIPNVIAQSNEYIQEMVDAVSQDSLESYIGAMQSFGTRYEFTANQESCATYILGKMDGRAEADWYNIGLINFYDIDYINDNAIAIAGSSNIVLYSSDGGSSWIRGIIPSGAFNFYGIDFINSEKGWAAAFNGAIFATTDGGINWIQQYTEGAASLNDIAFIDDTSGIAVGIAGVIVRTSNGGSTWTQIVTSNNQSLRELSVYDANHIWAVGDSGTIIFSSDRGLNWTKQTNPNNSPLMGVDFLNANNGWAVGIGPTILKTTNGGTLWTSVAYANGMSGYVRGVSLFSESCCFVLDRYSGIFKTEDGGLHWNQVFSAMILGWGPYLYRIKKYGSQNLAIIGNEGLIKISSDGGNSWDNKTKNLPLDLNHQSRNVLATFPGAVTPEKECVMVAHYDSYSTGNLYTTAPGANDNASGTSAIIEAARLFKDYNFESTIKLIAVSGEELGMRGSTDFAVREYEQARNIIGVVNGDMIGYPVTPDTTRLVVCSYLNRNWLVDSALIYNQRYGIGLTLVDMVDNSAASDYGPFAALGYDALDIGEASAEEIWGGADPFYHTPNDSLDKLCPSLIRKGAQLMTATIAELAKPIGRITGVKDTKPDIPKEFCLEQNFPNPFNPTTNIRFTIKEVGWTKLTVFNMLGREVAILCNEERKSGNYQVTWNASTMSSGVYFYQLKSGNFIETKKMLLLK